jgi:hypothetical protein
LCHNKDAYMSRKEIKERGGTLYNRLCRDGSTHSSKHLFYFYLAPKPVTQAFHHVQTKITPRAYVQANTHREPSKN